MKKILLVSGCSITHGAELVDGFMHPDNIQRSYSSHLSKWLDVDLINVALSGSSNEYIFHSILSALNDINADCIHSVIVAWTSIHRLHWINKGRHWFFIPGWASSMKDLYDWKFHQHPTNSAFITGDSTQILQTLHDQHKFFIENYLDDEEFLSKKLSNYKSVLESYCENKKIKLIQLDILDYWTGPGHPNIEQHIGIANKLYKDFY